MSTIFARTQQSFSRRSLNQHFLIPKRWESTHYTGYVNFFNRERLWGFLIREDAPDQNYRFTASDLNVETVPQVRKYQQVSFQGLTNKQGSNVAKEVTGPNGDPLIYSYENLRLPISKRTQLLSSLENAETTRFRGVVKKFEHQKGGFITPIEVGFKDVHFDVVELQTTGKESIVEGAEVEFLVQTRQAYGTDKAVCITRPGGGLINEDNQEAGKTRRLLGVMYKEEDIEARIPSDFNGESERREGYVATYNNSLLHGYILPFDNPSEQVFVSIDDCHIFGKRALRKFQHVEFYSQKTSSGESRAYHVSGSGKTVLRYTSPNQYVPRHEAHKVFAPDSGSHKGHVIFAPKDKSYFLIKPDEVGYVSVLGFQNSILKMNVPRLDVGVSVEFTVAEKAKDAEKREEESQQAAEVTAGGGRPFCNLRGTYGKYLAERFDLAKPQRELAECPLKGKGEKYNGWISSFSSAKKKGTIEIEAPAEERYRKVVFDASNAVLSEQLFSDVLSVQSGAEVTVELRPFSPEKKEVDSDEKEREQVLTQEAFNVVSRNANVLRLSEKRQQRTNRFPQEKRL